MSNDILAREIAANGHSDFRIRAKLRAAIKRGDVERIEAILLELDQCADARCALLKDALTRAHSAGHVGDVTAQAGTEPKD